MNIAVISLIALVLTIAVGIKFDVNCGVVAGIFALILAIFFIPDMSFKDIYELGWPTGTFFMMMSIMFLFGIAQINGTLEKISKKVIQLLKGKNKLMPFAFYLLAFTLSGAGAGPGVAAMVLPIAMSVCMETGIKVYIMGVAVVAGAISGGLSPTSVSGVVASQLALDIGVTSYMSIYVPYLIGMFLEVVIVYVLFGGLKIENKKLESNQERIIFEKDQIKTLVVIGIVLIGILFFKQDVGLSTFVGAAVLILIGVANEKEAINSINWGTLLLVGGVAMLIHIVRETGGIDIVSTALAKIITPKTGTAAMVLSGGALSSVSSAVGVAMPTLIPTCKEIADSLGGTVSVTSLVAGVVAGANSVIYCPFSTLGAMTLATVPESVDRKKYFNQMLATGIISVFFMSFLGLIGLFGWFTFL